MSEILQSKLYAHSKVWKTMREVMPIQAWGACHLIVTAGVFIGLFVSMRTVRNMMIFSCALFGGLITANIVNYVNVGHLTFQSIGYPLFGLLVSLTLLVAPENVIRIHK